MTGRFGECLDRLKERLADPVGDRVVEGLRIAREVGGGELGRLLRNLSGYLRDDARTRSELESRQAWTVNGARLAVAAPWLVLLLHVLPARGDPPLRLARRRASCCAVGAALCVVAYRLMVRIGRLPDRAADPVVTPAVVGCAARCRAGAAGLLLVGHAGRSMLRRPQLAVRVLPYVRDLPQVDRRRPARRRPRTDASAAVCSARCCARRPTAVERVLGGAASVRRRLERAGLDDGRRTSSGSSRCSGGWSAFARGRGVLRAPVARRPRRRPCRCWCFCAIAFALGVLLRENRLTAQVTDRERRILAEFPTVAELLALAVAAGESPVAALDRVVRRSRGELSADLAAVLAEVRTGDARRARVRRAGRAAPGCRVVSRFAEGIAVAVERGTPLADVLHAQAGRRPRGRPARADRVRRPQGGPDDGARSCSSCCRSPSCSRSGPGVVGLQPGHPVTPRRGIAMQAADRC